MIDIVWLQVALIQWRREENEYTANRLRKTLADSTKNIA